MQSSNLVLVSSLCVSVRIPSVYQTQRLILSPAWRVQPRNYLLFACHTTNTLAQSVQDVRFLNYWYNGGREKKLGLTAEPKGKVTEAVEAAREEAKKVGK